MRRAWFLLFVLFGCGGRAEEGAARPELPSPEAGAPAAEGGQSGASTNEVGGQGRGTSLGGDATSRPEPGADAGAAGAAGMEPALPIGSGARYCDNELYCFGLACYAPERLYDRVCVSECTTSDDCDETEVCLQSQHLLGTCYRRCDHVSDCAYGFDCFDFTRQHEELVCFPTRWAAYWTANEL